MKSRQGGAAVVGQRNGFYVVLVVVILFTSGLVVVSGVRAAGSTNLLGRHVTAEAVEGSSPNLPIIVTSTFFTIDPRICSWVEFQNVTRPSHLVRWDFTDPSSTLYVSSKYTYGDPGAGKTFASAVTWSCTGISGFGAANRPGTWQVKIYFDGGLVATDSFRVMQPPWGLAGVRSAIGDAGGGGHGIVVDPVTNEVYVVGSGDNGQFCVTVGTQTSCSPGVYLRGYDGKNLTQILKVISGTTVAGNFVGNYCSLAGANTLKLIHNQNGPVDVAVLSGTCVWDYHAPYDQSSLVVNPGFQGTWAIIEPKDCVNGFLNHACTSIDVNPALTVYNTSQGPVSLSDLIYNNGSYLCSIHAVSCALNLGTTYDEGRFSFDPSNNRIYALGTNNNVFFIDATKMSLINNVQIPPGLFHVDSSSYIAADPVTNRVYVTATATNSGLIIINGSTGSVVARLSDVPRSPIAIDTRNDLLYMYSWSGTWSIYVMSGSSNSVIAQVPIPSQCDPIHTDNIAVNPALGYVYTTVGSTICQFSLPVAAGSSPRQVVINEVALNPSPGVFTGKNGTQWAEIYNVGSSPVDIGGWTLTPLCQGSVFPTDCSSYDGSFSPPTVPITARIPDGTMIPPNGYYVYQTPGFGSDSWLGLANNTIVLRDAGGRIVDWTPPLSDPNVATWHGGTLPASPLTWQRYPDGTDNWRLMPATKGSQNLNTTTTKLQVGQRIQPVTITSNSTVSGLSFNQAQNQLSLQVTGPANTHGTAHIGFANTLLNGTISVQLDGTPLTATISRNATYTLIAVIYSHSTHTITVTGTAVVVTSSSSASTTSATTTTSSPSTTASTATSTATTSTTTSGGGTAATTPTTSATTTSTSASGGGGIPEFPYQFLAVTVFTVLVTTSYLMVRHRTSRGQPKPRSLGQHTHFRRSSNQSPNFALSSSSQTRSVDEFILLSYSLKVE